MTSMQPGQPDPEQQREMEDDYGYAPIYTAQLLYKEKPVIDHEALYAKIIEYTGPIRTSDDFADDTEETLAVWEARSEAGHEEDEDHYHFFHLNHTLNYQEGAMPVQTVLMPVTDSPTVDRYESSLQQSWHWLEAAATVEACQHEWMLTDMMARGMPPQRRLPLFNSVLRAILEVAPCEAVYYKASDKLVPAAELLQSLQQEQPLYGALNIRLYQIPGEGERKEMVMDSCGLAALGVPDVQCHFYDMEPGEVAQFLMNVADYVYHQGDIIADGETIGLHENQRWRAEHQYSLVMPRRVVLDLDPGAPYYAGHQQAHTSNGGQDQVE
ncbi:DUF4261 domain-containing protein [Paenibacillus campi]|uniref:DUF4261 domain-containing protein n=1 Tax=Paenibacillus campi TaxID=3106031 RepID=UPI002AFFA218|nr:DUF4261 domain-containing protein [Paenibacillus sp. SGZ-1009]